MKILITGCAGFIGSHLADYLLEKGDKVTGIDNFSTGSYENIKHLHHNKNFVFKEVSVLDKGFDPLVSECDQIYHLAAAVGVKKIIEEPVKSIRAITESTSRVLDSALQNGKKKVLIASSSEVYGKNSNHVFNEKDDSVTGHDMRWLYSSAKKLDEFLSRGYFMDKGLPVVIVRFFNVVGPRQTGKYGMVIPRFVEQALKNEPITVFGNGKQTRCFGYVGDIVECVVKLMNNSKAVGEGFNVGSDNQISILDLAKKVIELTGSKSEIKFIPYGEIYGKGFEDIIDRKPDLTKVESLVGNLPRTNLNEILDKVIFDKSQALSISK